MSDAGLERGLEQLGDGGGPPAAWQETVLARIEVPPAAPPRARWPLVVAGSGLLAAAAAVVLFVALRTPEGPAPAATPPPARESGAAADRIERQGDRIEGEMARIQELQEHAYEKVLEAVTEAERAQAERQLWQAKKDARAVGKALQELNRKARKRDDDGAIAIKCDPNDPLCAVE